MSVARGNQPIGIEAGASVLPLVDPGSLSESSEGECDGFSNCIIAPAGTLRTPPAMNRINFSRHCRSPVHWNRKDRFFAGLSSMLPSISTSVLDIDLHDCSDRARDEARSTTPSGNNHVRPCAERASQEDPDEGRQFDEVITIARGLWFLRQEVRHAPVCVGYSVPYSICA